MTAAINRFILVFSGVRAVQSLFFCVVIVDHCLPFCLFIIILPFVLSVAIRFAVSYYPFGIFMFFVEML